MEFENSVATFQKSTLQLGIVSQRGRDLAVHFFRKVMQCQTETCTTSRLNVLGWACVCLASQLSPYLGNTVLVRDAELSDVQKWELIRTLREVMLLLDFSFLLSPRSANWVTCARPDEMRPKRLLGEGSFAKVWASQIGGIEVAEKHVQYCDEYNYHHFVREVAALRALHDVAGVPDILFVEPGILCTPLGGDTLARVAEQGSYSFDQVEAWSVELIKTMLEVHARDVAHRDLSAFNVVLSTTAQQALYIIDWGTAVVNVSKHNLVDLETYVTTRWYRPPEQVAFYPFAGDIWSLGCLLGELVMRQPIFPVDSRQVVDLRRRNQAVKHITQRLVSHPALARVINGMLNLNPLARMSFEQALQELSQQ
jgi:serine/threonine protein kinase